jgi:putative DNA primase/helicase
MSTPNYDRIPQELRALPNWVVWREELRRNHQHQVKKTKVPYNAITHQRAKSNDPSTWATFEQAQAALGAGRGYHGLGFCLSGDYIGVDLDGCISHGIVESWAQAIIRQLDSYAEISPSGTGIHIIVRGQLPDGRREKDLKDRAHHGVALYHALGPRYLTMTGNVIPISPIAAEAR